MACTLYRMSFRLASGLHAGWFPVGNILKTRPYVTGRTLWGAVTARLVSLGLEKKNAAGFEKAGKMIAASLCCGYLFPFTPSESAEGVPQHCAGHSDLFEYRFLDTYSSTALQYGAGAAESGSLHEIEFIRFQTRSAAGAPSEPVVLVGYLVASAADCIDAGEHDLKLSGISLRTALAGIQLGGKRNYGFGRVELLEFASTTTIFGARFLPESGTFRLPPGAAVPAHLQMKQVKEVSSGRVEPLVGREWQESRGFGAGQYVTPANICWAPGATLAAELNCAPDAFGVWQRLTLPPSREDMQ